MAEYRYKYPHPAITADAAVFGFDGRDMHILLIRRAIDPYKDSWALPGGFMNIHETIDDCARRELAEETGLRDIYLQQLHVFSAVHRDPRERVVTVAYFALVRKSAYQLLAGDDAADARWFCLDSLPPLAFDHADIIALARTRLAETLRHRPIAFELLDATFTMPELQRIYETINGVTYDRRNFAKKMFASGCLRPVGQNSRNTNLYRLDEEALSSIDPSDNPFDI